MTATFYSSNGCSRSLPPPAPAAASPAISRLLRGSRGPGHRVLRGAHPHGHGRRGGVPPSLRCPPLAPRSSARRGASEAPAPPPRVPATEPGPAPRQGRPRASGPKAEAASAPSRTTRGPRAARLVFGPAGSWWEREGSAGDAGREAAAGAALGQGVWVSGSTLRDPAWRRRLFFKRPVSFRVFIYSKSDALRLRSERPAPKSPRDAQGRCHTRLRSPTPGGLLPPPPAAPEPGLRAAEPGVGGDQGSPSAGRPGPGSSGAAGEPSAGSSEARARGLPVRPAAPWLRGEDARGRQRAEARPSSPAPWARAGRGDRGPPALRTASSSGRLSLRSSSTRAPGHSRADGLKAGEVR